MSTDNSTSGTNTETIEQKLARIKAKASARTASGETPIQKLARIKKEREAEQQAHDMAYIASTNVPKYTPPEVLVKETTAEKLARIRNSTIRDKATSDDTNAKLEALRAKSREKLERLKRSTIDGKIKDTSPTVSLVLPKHVVGSTSDSTSDSTDTNTSGEGESATPSTQFNKDEISYEQLNEEQRTAVKLAEQAESYNLIGSAGSGKTTTTRVVATVLKNSGVIGTLPEDTKVLKKGSPSIIIVSFTNQAVRNIKEALPEEFKPNCLTIHKVLEYSPVYYDIEGADGTMKKTMRFEPQRGIFNPINGITHCVIEEAGSVSVELFDELRGAVGRDTTFIYLGDLNQLPPVFGDAILGFKLLEHPIVELKHTYRQDSDSNIKKLAYRILEGRPIGDKELQTYHKEGELEIVKFKQRVAPDRATVQMGEHFQQLVRDGEFTPGVDQVLIPFGKAGTFGATDLNKYIAHEDAILREAETYEVIVGFTKQYFAIGDYVMHDKQKWKISAIEKNSHYLGASPQPASKHLDRWGNNPDILEAHTQEIMSAEEMDNFFAVISEASSGDNENKIQQASHIITLDCQDNDMVRTISTVGDVTDLALAYALTVHKSQGSEWGRVFCIFHESHAVMAKREILYTATTRARKFLRIYYSGERTKTTGESFFQKGITNQYIKGTTLEHKLNFFRGKVKIRAIKDAAKKKAGL